MPDEIRKTPTQDSRRIHREKQTGAAMIGIYCRAHHGSKGRLCEACAELLAYVNQRLDRCPFGPDKPVCAECSIHCYKPSMQKQIREVMRFAGPRMLFRHPILAVRHIVDTRRRRT